MRQPDDVLRELHHRVKNNFQIIASLLNLQKRMRPPERRDDLRFIEEHVQAMAIAHQVMYAAPELTSVPVNGLVGEVLDSMVQIGGIRAGVLTTELAPIEHGMGLNQAIALCLYIAVVAPPCLDRAAAAGATARVTLEFEEPHFVLAFADECDAPVELDFLRGRLAEAYLRQLGGEAEPPAGPRRAIRFALDAPRTLPADAEA